MSAIIDVYRCIHQASRGCVKLYPHGPTTKPKKKKKALLHNNAEHSSFLIFWQKYLTYCHFRLYSSFVQMYAQLYKEKGTQKIPGFMLQKLAPWRALLEVEFQMPFLIFRTQQPTVCIHMQTKAHSGIACQQEGRKFSIQGVSKDWVQVTSISNNQIQS